MDFLTWIFDKHYIVSSIVLPGFSMFWGIHTGSTVRAVVCGALWLFSGNHSS